ncbi:MAG: 50S ribosomal protein L29 [Bacteroidia bacterium]|jgi:large subunit ribosomal protein L29
MKNAEIRELSDKELVARIREEKTQQTKLNFTHAVSPMDNPNRLKEVKKTIARLLTEHKRRQIANA